MASSRSRRPTPSTRRRSSSRSRRPASSSRQAEVVAVSAKTGTGLDELRAALGRAADLVAQSHYLADPARLYVDRVFSLRGIGTVVTGTLWSGTIGEGDVLRAEPTGREVRVRSVQVHEQPVERAEAGQRVALALPGVERSELRRGDALVAPAAFTPGYRLDVSLQELEPIPDGARLLVHHGTSAVPARVVRAGDVHAQLRLARPVVAARGDRVVLRGATTVGGGVVLDATPARHADPARFEPAERGETVVYAPTLVDGEWRFSDEWLAELHARAGGADRRGRSARPGCDRADRAVGEGRTRPASVRAARVEALPPGRRAEPRRAVRGRCGARSPARRCRARRDQGRGRGARALPRAGGQARAARRRLRDLSARPTSAPERSSSRSARPPAGSRSPASATSQAAAAATRSCVLERLDADGVTRRVRDERLLRRRPSEPPT